MFRSSWKRLPKRSELSRYGTDSCRRRAATLEAHDYKVIFGQEDNTTGTNNTYPCYLHFDYLLAESKLLLYRYLVPPFPSSALQMDLPYIQPRGHFVRAGESSNAYSSPSYHSGLGVKLYSISFCPLCRFY